MENLTLFLELYKETLRLRRIEEKIASEYGNWKMRCPVHLSIGQEGPSAAFALLQGKEDYAVSSHRAHTHYLAKGGDLRGLIAELYGKHLGCSGGKGGSMHLFDRSANFMGSSAIVGNSIPIGVGLGYHLKLSKAPGFSYIFLGDGAIEEGVFYESASFAVLHNLPVIFMCENNGYSVYTNLLTRQTSESNIRNIANGIGLRFYQVDGNNPVECYNKLKESINDFNSQPIFLEFLTSRFLEHCGPNEDHALGYRTQKEIDALESEDPLIILKEQITKSKFLEFRKWEFDAATVIDLEIESAFNFAENARFPTLEEILDYGPTK
jgi:TPP-dependent pyruvate/acetoin dehydrogenase alpha subunit